MADRLKSTPASNGHVAAEPSTVPATSSSSSRPPAEVRVLVVTPIAAIVKELQSRLSTLPANVTVEVADTLNEQHLDEQIAAATVIFGEPKEIHNKLHVRTAAAQETGKP